MWRHAAGLAIFFFFFGSADPRIFEDSNGSSADPDRSGFRWIRFTPIENHGPGDGPCCIGGSLTHPVSSHVASTKGSGLQ